MAALLQELRDDLLTGLRTAARWPAGARYTFDRDTTDGPAQEPPRGVLKTTCRQLVSRRFDRFESREVVRTEGQAGGCRICHSPQLAALVPPGGRYTYDLIAYVGVETLLRGRSLRDMAVDLAELRIPFSSLCDLQQKFLFYFGHLHRQSAPRLRDYLERRGEVTWLIDSTLEPGTPLYFGVYEAQEEWMLGCWKIASENLDDVARCVAELREIYGLPQRVLHDLSDTMIGACQQALPGVPHHVCQFHLLRDIGDDLYEAPQAALVKLLRQLKLQVRMKVQRAGQTLWLRENMAIRQAQLILSDLLQGRPVDAVCADVFKREVLIAFHQWMLDYASDGQRQGFPFDPILLYFHRRVVRAAAALDRLQESQAAPSLSPAYTNLSRMMNAYLQHPEVIVTVAHFEAACTMFERLRSVLRLSAQGSSPMHESYSLTAAAQQEVHASLQRLRDDCRQQSREHDDPWQRKLAAIVCTHLDRYWSYLPDGKSAGCERTTNGLESHWGRTKRARRRAHGRGKLTRDFQALPEELMLIPNLRNPSYVEQVLGTLEALPDKLAETGQSAGPFSRWNAQRKQTHLGRLPKRLVRDQNLIENLLECYQSTMEPLHNAAS